MTETTPTNRIQPLSRRVTTGLAKIGLAMRSQARSGASRRRLSPTQGEILAFLHARPGSSLSLVADALGVTRPTVSDAVDTLVRKGLVLKRRAERDPRVLSLQLTPQGLVEAEGAETWSDSLCAAVESLPREEQESWLRGLMQMIHSLEASGALNATRMCTNCRYFTRDYLSGDTKPHRCALFDTPLADSDMRIDCPQHMPVAS